MCFGAAREGAPAEILGFFFVGNMSDICRDLSELSDTLPFPFEMPSRVCRILSVICRKLWERFMDNFSGSPFPGTPLAHADGRAPDQSRPNPAENAPATSALFKVGNRALF